MSHGGLEEASEEVKTALVDVATTFKQINLPGKPDEDDYEND